MKIKLNYLVYLGLPYPTNGWNETGIILHRMTHCVARTYQYYLLSHEQAFRVLRSENNA